MIDMATQRRLTKDFIDALPSTITLIPRSKVKQPAGGWVWVDGTPRPPQVVSVVESGQNPTPEVTLDGVQREVLFHLVCEHTASIARHDVFTHNGKDWEVVELWYDNGWEIRALVAGRG